MALESSLVHCSAGVVALGCPSTPGAPAWIFLASDLVVAFVYFSLPVMILYIFRKRRDSPLAGMAVLFACFLFIGGLTRIEGMVWHGAPLPWAHALAHLAIAGTAALLVVLFLTMLPRTLTLPSRRHMAGVIRQLEEEIVKRKQIEEAFCLARDEMESRIQQRTVELFRRNQQLYAEIIEHHRLEAALRETQLVVSSAQRLALSNAGFDSQKILADLLILLAENHPFPTSSIFRPDRRNGSMVCVAMHGMPQEGASCFHFTDGLLADAARSGRIRIIGCVDRTRAADACSDADTPGGHLSHVMIVPVTYQDVCLSILVLAGKRAFSASEIAFVDSLRAQVGVAQHNLQLYADSKRLAKKLHSRNREIAQKNLQLQSISRTKSEFVANMSHELRTPLNAIIGFTGTLLMQLPGPLTSEQDKQLRTVQGSARHLLSLINDLLNVEKIESGKLDIRFEQVNVQAAVREIFDLLQPLALQKNLEFQMSLPPADIAIQTDRRALSQILLNLVNNAIKFTERGQVAIRLSRRHAGVFGTVELVVSDTGIGIDAHRQGQLFQAFTQLDSGPSRRFDGTGLGLYLSRRLATLVGGELLCRSASGAGSVFTLALPVNQP